MGDKIRPIEVDKIRLHNMYFKKEDSDPNKRSDIKVHFKIPGASGFKPIDPRPSLDTDPNYKEFELTTVTLYVEEHAGSEPGVISPTEIFVDWGWAQWFPNNSTFLSGLIVSGSYNKEDQIVLHIERVGEDPIGGTPTTVNVQVGGN